MNDKQPPVEAAVDEVLGARIVAWVLGEASAFEVAELERLCGEDASLREFHRRMRHLHEMLGRAEPSAAAGEWMLPPEKRRVLEERLGVAGPKPVSRPTSFANKSARRALFGIAACLLVTLAVMRLIPGVKQGGVDIMGGAETLLSAAAPGSLNEFGDSDEFGSGWGGGAAATAEADARRPGFPSTPPPAPPAEPAQASLKAANPASLAPVPTPPRFALGDAENGRARRGGEPAQPQGLTREFETRTAGLSLELAREKTDGSPAGPDSSISGIVTGGLRSGDAGIDRNSIDAILNNPERLGVDTARDRETADSAGYRYSADPGAANEPATPADAVPELATMLEFSETPAKPADKQAEGEGIVTGPEPAAAAAPGLALSGLAGEEMLRRSEIVSDSDRLLLEGREAYSKGDYAEAVEKYRQAKDQLPEAPLLEERQKSYAGHLADASVALAQQHRKVGKYIEASQLLEEVLDPSVDPDNALARAALDGLDDPLRTNPALAAEHTQDVDAVRRSLYIAEGNLNLGKFDEAKREYEKTLNIDPHNSAARRGLERIEAAKSDYDRAAFDHARAELLVEVDAAWELSVPRDKEVVEALERGGEMEPQNPVDEVDAAVFTRQAPVIDQIETNPAESPYSTFSLNISDASFRIAAAAVERGERPDPGQVKAEQFYNAVDYGDPAPIGSEPVAGLVEQAAHPVIPNRNLVRIALRTAAAGRAASQPLRLTLVVDQSGSMLREDRRAALLSAAQQLGVLLGERDLVNVVGFSRTPRLIAEGIRGDDNARLVDALGQPADEGGTNLEEALKLAHEIAARHYDPQAQNRVVLLTDGAANLGDADPNTLSGRVVALRQADLSLDVVGIGIDGLNDRLLAEIARHGNGRYHVLAASDDEADDAFARQLAGAFRPAAQDVKVQVVFNSERVSGYKLIGFDDDLLRPEDFRNDAVDAAELAAEEAGVALYQVRTDPEGSGDIGSVSVRFRETSGGEVIERSWIIPYEPAAPAFDRAPPSMQLAGLAMLAAEKLRGGEMANLIDFGSLAGSKAAVRSHYASSRQVGRLLSMIDAIQ